MGTKPSSNMEILLGLTAVKIVEPLIGTKIRIAEEGECILHDPNAVHVISDTIG